MNNSGSSGSSSGMMLMIGGVGLLVACCCSCVSSLIAYEKNWMGLQDMLGGEAEDAAAAEVYDAPAEDTAVVDSASGLCEAGKYASRVNPVPAGKAAKWVCPANWWTTGDGDAAYACAQTQDCANRRNTWAKDNGKNPAAPYFMSAAEYDLIKSTGDANKDLWKDRGRCKWEARKTGSKGTFCAKDLWDTGDPGAGHACTPDQQCAQSVRAQFARQGTAAKGMYKSKGFN